MAGRARNTVAWFEVFIPSLDGPGITLTLEAPNWIGALRTGLQNIGEGQASISNVMCDIKEDNSIHVTDVASHRIFRLREVPKPGALPLPKPPTAPAPPAPAVAGPGASRGSDQGFSTGPKTLLEFQRPDFSKLAAPATVDDEGDPDTIQTTPVESITMPSSPPTPPTPPRAPSPPMGGGQSTIEMSIPWATMPPPSSASPMPGVTLPSPSASPTSSLPPAMSQASPVARGPSTPRPLSPLLDSPTSTTEKSYDLTLRQTKAPGLATTAPLPSEAPPSSVPRDISLPPSAPVAEPPRTLPPASVFPPLPPLSPADKTSPSQAVPSPPGAAAQTSALLSTPAPKPAVMPSAPKPTGGTAPVMVAAPLQPAPGTRPTSSPTAPVKAPLSAPPASTPVPVQQKASPSPSPSPSTPSLQPGDVTERLPRAPGRGKTGPVPSPTPRGTPAPPPKRASGQFESAPRPVSREVSRENPVLTPAQRVSAEDIADAVADVFDATQDLLMEGAVEPRRVAEALLDIALAHVPAESGSFYLADLNGHVLSFAAVRGPKADAIRRGKFTVPVGQGIIGFCALEGICLRVADMQKDPHYAAGIANAVGYAVKDTLCASAEKDGRLYGAIQLINAKSGFTAVHMEVLRYIGLTAAQLLERHYENA